MVIDHANRLHVRVYDGRADKGESPLLKVFAERFRLRGNCRDLGHMLPFVHDRLVSDKLPYIGIETAKLFLHFQESPGVVDGRADLELVADDPEILQQAFVVFFGIASHLPRIEF